MAKTTPPVAISGMGAVTCAGGNVESLWNAALAEKSHIKDGFGQVPEEVFLEIKKMMGACSETSRSVVLAWAAAKEAMSQAGWTSLNDDDGIILGTTTGQIDLWETEIIRFLKNEMNENEIKPAFQNQALGATSEILSESLNFSGDSMVITSACSASTQAIALATHWLNLGKVKRCLVGGVEVLSRLTVEGFRSLQLLNPHPATPFDENRQGINLAEGAGFLCLELNPKNKLAVVSGSGLTSDAYHMTSPEPNGEGCFGAMKSALEDAGLKPDDIDWIHAHGTGSKANDEAEGRAINALFKNKVPWVSSTKNIHGHTLGASGIVETILCVKSLNEKILLKTSGLNKPDVSVPHPEKHLQGELKHILKNTLGFGGNNAALVLSR